MTQQLADRPSNGYDEETFNLALTALAMHGGNARRARAYLQDNHALEVGRSTLYRWRECDRYKQIRAELVPQLQERTAQQYEDVASTLLAAQQKLAERLLTGTAAIPRADVPKALKFVSDAATSNTTQANVLRGRPTQITEHRNADDLLRKLKAAGVIDIHIEETQQPQPVPQLASAGQTGPHAYVRKEDGPSSPAAGSTPGQGG